MHFDMDRWPKWDGAWHRDFVPPREVARRDELADAARAGNFERVIGILGQRDNRHWINSTRLNGQRRYTPLHQAAWHGSPASHVERLLAFGAWRTMRTSTGQRPVDIAQERGHYHLTHMLQPEIKYHVPREVLAGLQRNLHALITGYDSSAPRYLRLPELEVLTELDAAAYWIRVTGGIFAIALRGSELTAEAIGKMDYDYHPTFRITDTQVYTPEGEPWTPST
ncbi:hypothetical protein ACF1GY_05495 [Streptomyces sp. NPDC014684]|uniref:hypothetical protein n=1 Tax=Streptomyces sp. NPDC014684 TaxID=3364880 RepID=UPI0036FBA920